MTVGKPAMLSESVKNPAVLCAAANDTDHFMACIDLQRKRRDITAARSWRRGHCVGVMGAGSGRQGHGVRVMGSGSQGQGHRVRVTGSGSWRQGQGHGVRVMGVRVMASGSRRRGRGVMAQSH